MKPKFKIGNKVKIIGNSLNSDIPIGTKCEIVDIDGYSYDCKRLDIVNEYPKMYDQWHNETDLKLIK